MVCFWNSSTLDALKRSAVWFGSLGGLVGTFGSGLGVLLGEGCYDGWLVGWLIGWLDGWLVRW